MDMALNMKDWIRQELQNVEKGYVAKILNMTGAYRREIERTKEYHGRQLLELLQNADDEAEDAKDPTVLIRLESDSSAGLSDDETRIVLKEIIDDVMLPRIAFEKVSNTFLFKAPLNVVITNHKPEYDFVRHLVDPENAAAIDSWIKSTDRDFYSIDYSWRKGEHAKRSSFNPDFFIKIGTHIFVIEIKGDEELSEPSDENKAKFKAATQHFKTLNEQQDEIEYRFHFLTPTNYDIFFKYLRDKNYDFFSNLDAELDNGT